MDRNESQLRSAVDELALPADSVALCQAEDGAAIADRIMDAFVRDRRCRWWWACLKSPGRVIDYPEGDGYRHLLEYVPAAEGRCWLVVESDRDGPWIVADAEVACIPDLLDHCSHFEYYLVGKGMDWLVAENHHNQLVISGSAAG
jgi:uncharacterized protein DUF6756